MPLEISEIGVHIAVGAGAGPAAPAPDHPGGGGPGLTPSQHEEIVNACVQQVLANLKQMKER